MPVCLLVAKVQKIFQIIDGYARFLRERNKNKGRETEAEDVGAASRPAFELIDNFHYNRKLKHFTTIA